MACVIGIRFGRGAARALSSGVGQVVHESVRRVWRGWGGSRGILSG